jgi:Nif-specific regulatory protein
LIPLSLRRGPASAPPSTPPAPVTADHEAEPFRERGFDLDGGSDERRRLVEAMEAAGWVQAKAARLLGLTARQIGYALRKYEIPIKKF